MVEHPQTLGQRFAKVAVALETLLDERAHAIEEHGEDKLSCSHDLGKAREKLSLAQDEALAALERDEKAQLEELEKRQTKRTRKLERAHADQREPLESERLEATDRAHARLRDQKEEILLKSQPKLDRLEAAQEQTALAFRMLQQDVGVLEDQQKALGLKVGADVIADPLPEQEHELAEVRPYLAQSREALDTLAWNTQVLSRSQAMKLGRPAASGAVIAVVIGIHGLLLFLLTRDPRPTAHFAYLGASFASFLLVSIGITYALRNRARQRVRDLLGGLRELSAAMAAQGELQEKHYWSSYRGLLDKRHDALAELDAAFEGTRGKREQIELKLGEVDRKHRGLAEKWKSSDIDARCTLEQRIADAREALDEQHRRQTETLEAEHAARRARVEQRREEVLERTAEAWTDTLESIRVVSADAMRGVAPADWPALLAPEREWPTRFPSHVKIGGVALPLGDLNVTADDSLRVPDETLSFPLALAFPGCGSLVIHAKRAQREQAQEWLLTTTMRLLSTFPPGMCKLTIVDPVGLGQGLSALMELADHDEALVAGRIWTETTHIDRRLVELTEHMEKVIQKYLRNQFKTIDCYNADAGQMQEPYRFLLISDLPSGLSDLSMERLASIISSGARCGVHVLIHHDAEQPWPKQLDAGALAREGLSLMIDDAGVVRAEGMTRGHLVPEPPAPAEMVTPLLREIGTRAQDASRVELAFDAVAPKPDEIWTRSSARGIKVPVGRTGVTSLQQLDLGRGTAQHALIAGKTGSGKSTLFHVIITSTALWYSPDEVQLYLIDFKKGVEFKAYATRHLPHIQVVAIESDREFGLAVLKRIDEELDRRGELFRDAGVQDLAAYREATGKTMPRSLLLIDEFQEFFTEDDAVGHEASLLLDRFVRQGRAFGVHILLGSQTLSGVYSLAKSTLGQIGVRIALQCNESDSYLILGEDNGAARLLSRPGEAIYNDMAGLVEGNNPFQVVWLPDETHARQLKAVDARAKAAGLPESTIVFESSAAAELAKNKALAERLEKTPDAAAPLAEGQRVWLGEPNAIKGPTEAHFGPTGGSHLLILGQRIEAVFGMACASMIGLAASLPPERLRLIVLDGSGADSRYTKHIERIDAALPHRIEQVAYRDVPPLIAGLEAEVTAAQEAGVPPERFTVLFVLGLHRFRTLRQEDEYAMFGGGGDDAPKTGAQFATVLRDGPEQRISTFVWCDTLVNTNRSLSRRTLREFDQLVLFQMSAADSAELIDSRIANTLGLTNALLFVEAEGRMEKFRPYSPPTQAVLDGVRQTMDARGWQAPPPPEPPLPETPSVPDPTPEVVGHTTSGSDEGDGPGDDDALGDEPAVESAGLDTVDGDEPWV